MRFFRKKKPVELDVDKLLRSKGNILFRLSPNAVVYLDTLRDPTDAFPSDFAFYEGSLLDYDHSKYYDEKTRCSVFHIPGKTNLAFISVDGVFTPLGVYEAQIHATHEYKVDGVSNSFMADYAAINTNLKLSDKDMDCCEKFISDNYQSVYEKAMYQYYA